MYMDAVMKEVKIEMGKRRVRFTEKDRWGRLLELLYADVKEKWSECQCR